MVSVKSKGKVIQNTEEQTWPTTANTGFNRRLIALPGLNLDPFVVYEGWWSHKIRGICVYCLCLLTQIRYKLVHPRPIYHTQIPEHVFLYRASLHDYFDHHQFQWTHRKVCWSACHQKGNTIWLLPQLYSLHQRFVVAYIFIDCRYLFYFPDGTQYRSGGYAQRRDELFPIFATLPDHFLFSCRNISTRQSYLFSKRE